MNEQKIETFWRDATADDVTKVMRSEKVEARFRDVDDETWKDDEFFGGFRTFHSLPLAWIDLDGVQWTQCQVYDPPQWYLDKPDPGEGYRLLEKFPQENLQCNDEYWSRRENKWLPSPVAATGSHIQLNESWYRRRIEPIKVTEKTCVAYETQVGEVIQLPNGKRLRVTKEGFEVL